MDERTDKARKKRNKDLIHRMKAGHDMKAFDSAESWFPQRPLIKKDKKAMRRLYKRPPLHEV